MKTFSQREELIIAIAFFAGIIAFAWFVAFINGYTPNTDHLMR